VSSFHSELTIATPHVEEKTLSHVRDGLRKAGLVE
jgi:hypothetical protein